MELNCVRCAMPHFVERHQDVAFYVPAALRQVSAPLTIFPGWNKSMFDLLEELEPLRAEVRFHRSH